MLLLLHAYSNIYYILRYLDLFLLRNMGRKCTFARNNLFKFFTAYCFQYT